MQGPERAINNLSVRKRQLHNTNPKSESRGWENSIGDKKGASS